MNYTRHRVGTGYLVKRQLGLFSFALEPKTSTHNYGLPIQIGAKPRSPSIVYHSR
jgi:hypothetical protein